MQGRWKNTMQALSNYSIHEEYENILRNPQNYEGKEIVLMTCPKCNKPILKRLEDGMEIAMDCDCMIKERTLKKIQKFQKLSIIDRNAGKDVFSNAKTESKEEQELYEKIQKYTRGFKIALEKNCGLLFTGVPGNGKTFLANCICNSLKQKGYTVLSFSMSGYLRTIQDSFGKNDMTETNLLSAVRDADLLFIDDLGSEKLSEEWGKSKLFALIDERYRAGKPILITTNLSLSVLDETLKFNKVDKITDRIYEMVRIIPFTWGSKRRKTKKQYWE
ncbi:AAA family ATPase [Fusobacterium necrophorum subsp. funduliforme]|nr:AAA family ATPase [Fusobacterium necrophorum subsp. funduliforme]